MYFKVLKLTFWKQHPTFKNTSPLIAGQFGKQDSQAVPRLHNTNLKKRKEKKDIKDVSVPEQTDMLLETNRVLVSCLMKIHKYQWGPWHNSTPSHAKKATLKDSPVYFCQLQWAFLFTIYAQSCEQLTKVIIELKLYPASWKKNKYFWRLSAAEVSDFFENIQRAKSPGNGKWPILIS